MAANPNAAAMNRPLKICATCPFRSQGERGLLQPHVEKGHWFACEEATQIECTDVFMAPPRTVADKQRQWAREVECAGARLWRRSKLTPEEYERAMREETIPRERLSSDEAEAKTPALALCAASLRALAAKETRK